MTSVRQSHVTTMSSTNNHHDNNLDALLEELQTSVSRPGSSLGHNHNGPVSGYREVTRTVTRETAGQPPTQSTDYHIEYLTPSNTTTVLQEVTSPHRDRDLALMQDAHNTSGRNTSSYKTVQYQYNTSSSGSRQQDGAAVPGADIRMRQNITELDSLLDDLHTAQKSGFADTNVARTPAGVDPGLLEPLDSSTPRSGLVSRVEKTTVQEQRYGSVGQNRDRDRDRDVRKELVFTGGSGRREQPSPTPPPPVGHKEVYRYESKTTRTGNSSRDMSPPQDRRQPSPARQLASVRTYNYSSSDEVPRTPTMHRSPSPSGVRSSSTTRNEVRQYNYSNRDFSPEGVRQPPLRSPSPSTKVTTVRNYSYTTPQEPPRNTSSKVTTVNSYSYNTSSSENRSPHDVPRSPPPHRSPSPVSFTSPPMPSTKTSTTKTYNFDQSSHQPYQRPQSPQPVQKFSPSDPSRTLTYQVSPPPPQPPQPTVITYKYSSQTTHSSKYPGEEGAPLLPRPFPTPSPTPDHQQQPPKKLDELMASFSDTDIQQHHESTRYVPVREPAIQKAEAPARDAPPTPPPSAGPTPASTAAAMQLKSKNIAGPPVYYPPGVELFAKKEESMMQSQSAGGKYKAKGKAKYEYESSSKMKSKESSGKTVVPVCLPVCCAMPCVIM